MNRHAGQWHKSSYSEGASNCVESAAGAGTVYLRDSKLGAASPVLAFTPTEWATFLISTKSGKFGL